MQLTEQPAFIFRQGEAPVLLSLPHAGTYIPPGMAARMTDEARRVPDTDWHLEALYDFADELGVSVLVATHSRYVIDLNRPPDGASLYPGRSVTGLCPVETFDDTPIYLPGAAPDDAEVAMRREAVWLPYHEKLAAELDRIKRDHGIAGLWDAHSIRSVLPKFFEGKLPDLNLGSAQGRSCSPALAERVLAVAEAAGQDGFTSILNGRFTGGYITRRYGDPAGNVHAMQLEMTQSSYMSETFPFEYLPSAAVRVQPHVRRMVEVMIDHCQSAAA